MVSRLRRLGWELDWPGSRCSRANSLVSIGTSELGSWNASKVSNAPLAGSGASRDRHRLPRGGVRLGGVVVDSDCTFVDFARDGRMPRLLPRCPHWPKSADPMARRAAEFVSFCNHLYFPQPPCCTSEGRRTVQAKAGRRCVVRVKLAKAGGRTYQIRRRRPSC